MDNITKRQVAPSILIQLCLQCICTQCQFASDSILGIHHGGIDGVHRQHFFISILQAYSVHRLLAWFRHCKESEVNEIFRARVDAGGIAGGFMDPSSGRSDPRQACEESGVWGQSGGKHMLAPDWCDARYGMLGKRKITCACVQMRVRVPVDRFPYQSNLGWSCVLTTAQWFLDLEQRQHSEVLYGTNLWRGVAGVMSPLNHQINVLTPDNIMRTSRGQQSFQCREKIRKCYLLYHVQANPPALNLMSSQLHFQLRIGRKYSFMLPVNQVLRFRRSPSNISSASPFPA